MARRCLRCNQLQSTYDCAATATPALLRLYLQALTLAPLFVWFELLFLLGYRPQLYKQLQQRVTANIAAHKRKQ
jgi:uncharacterized membrane protein YGL010W